MAQATAALAGTAHRPVVIGICGAQGSGKSTLAAAVERQLRDDGIATATMSLDDLYLTRAERKHLASTIHPLLMTRGVPGTHDIALGLAVMDALARGEPALLPRFDKGSDDRLPVEHWQAAPRATQVLLFEGWCVGAVPQDHDALLVPVNDLERDEDPQGLWRAYVNAALAGRYQRLFARLDRLILLAAPGFGVVREWRGEQERHLREKAGHGASGVMDDAALSRFIQHYERLTRHVLAEMPQRATLTVRLDANRVPDIAQNHRNSGALK